MTQPLGFNQTVWSAHNKRNRQQLYRGHMCDFFLVLISRDHDHDCLINDFEVTPVPTPVNKLTINHCLVVKTNFLH